MLLDTKGPEIRTGQLKEAKPVELKEGSIMEIVTDTAIEGDAHRIACTYKSLTQTVEIGSTIYIDGGAITLEVTEVLDVSTQS